jgi:hypothetical protein
MSLNYFHECALLLHVDLEFDLASALSVKRGEGGTESLFRRNGPCQPTIAAQLLGRED